jgi:formylglycine-generating enzyme required for sulfatase activity
MGSTSFFLDATEVTVGAYRKCVEAGGCDPAHFDDGTCHVWDGKKWSQGKLPMRMRGDSQSVVCVDWNQAKGYCELAGKRLPTEAEWEKAARGGTTGARYGELDAIAWYDKNSGGGTRPVGEKQPNAFGLYDMFGNVFEWCADWYDERYYEELPGRDPKGSSSGEDRVLRGGSWGDGAGLARASFRVGFPSGFRSGLIGFRCAGSAAIGP